MKSKHMMSLDLTNTYLLYTNTKLLKNKNAKNEFVIFFYFFKKVFIKIIQDIGAKAFLQVKYLLGIDLLFIDSFKDHQKRQDQAFQLHEPRIQFHEACRDQECYVRQR